MAQTQSPKTDTPHELSTILASQKTSLLPHLSPILILQSNSHNRTNSIVHMPSVNPRNFTAQSVESQPAAPKTNPKLLCMVLKVIIMAIVISLFFLFLGVAAIILLNLCVAGGALRRRLQPNTSSGLSPQDVKTLPQFRFSESDPEKECVVCLERMRQGQWCRKLVGCTHVFHRRCVDMWLVKVAACPICRARVGFDSSATVADHSMQLWAIGRNSEFRVR